MAFRSNGISLLTTLLYICLTLNLSAQDQSEDNEINVKKLERKGSKLIDKSKWEEAKPIYRKLLSVEPDNNEYNFFAGLAYFNSGVNKETAARYFRKVRETEFPVVLLFLGKAYHYNGDFDLAKASFEDFLPLIASGTKAGKELMDDVQLHISYCEQGKKLASTKNEILRVDNLGKTINTSKTEYAPVLYEKDKYLVFTATNLGETDVKTIEQQTNANEDIYISEYILEDESWGQRRLPDSTVINPAINTSANESSIGFSADKSRFYYFSVKDQFLSENKGKTIAQNIDLSGVEQEDLIAIYLSPDEQTRYIVCEIEIGKGGLDIYSSQRTSDSTWSQWENMEGINTEYDEDSPFLNPQTNIFYFSSNRPQSMGGHDIFSATKNAEGIWNNITNLAPPINSTGNDIHYIQTEGNEDFGYLASDRMKGEGNMDLYHFWTCYPIKNTNINGKLISEKAPVDGTIVLKSQQGVLVDSIPVVNGLYSFPVNTKTSYIAEVTGKDLLKHTFPFTVPDQCSEYNIYQQIHIESINDNTGFKTNQNGAMKNGFFNIDRYRKEKSREEYFASVQSGNKFYTDPILDKIKIEKPPKDSVIVSDDPKILAAVSFEDVYFAFDKHNITEESKKIIDRAVAYLKANPKALVVLRGHTDSKGPASYNLILSKRRARSVARIVRAKGIPNSRIEVESYGEAKLKVPDTDKDGNYLDDAAKQNRRVEIRLKMKKN